MNEPVAAASGNICMLRSKLTLISGIIITTVTTNLPYNAATDLYVILQWQKKDCNAWLPFLVVAVTDIKA